jgi:hypothetical protein
MRRSVRKYEQRLQIACAQATGPFVKQCHGTCAAASQNMHRSVYACVQQSVPIRSIVMASVASGHVRNILRAHEQQRQDTCEGGLGRLSSSVMEPAKKRLCTFAAASGKPRSSVCARAQQRQGMCTASPGHVCCCFSATA